MVRLLCGPQKLMENNCGTTYAIPLRLGPSYAQCPVASYPACSPAEFLKSSEEVCTATPSPQLTLANTPKFGNSPTSHLSTDPNHLQPYLLCGPQQPHPAQSLLASKPKPRSRMSPCEKYSGRIQHEASLRARRRPAARSQSETTASTSPASALIRPQRYGPSRSLRQITLPAFR